MDKTVLFGCSAQYFQLHPFSRSENVTNQKKNKNYRKVQKTDREKEVESC